MKYVDEFRDPERAKSLLEAIRGLTVKIMIGRDKPLHIMEVCGGHTHAIFKYGIANLLPAEIELVHGPGCPVCVLPIGQVDDCVAIAETPGVIFTTFGDAMRVPGSKKSLLQAKAEGADIRMVYSPLDALDIARENPQREVVFFGLGFETTMPATAFTLLQAEAEGVANFSVFCNHITIIPTMQALLDSPDLDLDGFLGPGHVSMVIGTAPYDFVAELLPSAARRGGLRAAGYSPFDLARPPAIGGGPRGDRQSIRRASCRRTAIVPRSRRLPAFSSCANFSNGAALARLIIRASGCGKVMRASMPSANSLCRP